MLLTSCLKSVSYYQSFFLLGQDKKGIKASLRIAQFLIIYIRKILFGGAGMVFKEAKLKLCLKIETYGNKVISTPSEVQHRPKVRRVLVMSKNLADQLHKVVAKCRWFSVRRQVCGNSSTLQLLFFHKRRTSISIVPENNSKES